MYLVFKKLVSILATSAPAIKANKKDQVLIKWLYIYYLHCFKKDISQAQILLSLNKNINVMILMYLYKLGFWIYLSNVKA